MAASQPGPRFCTHAHLPCTERVQLVRRHGHHITSHVPVQLARAHAFQCLPCFESPETVTTGAPTGGLVALGGTPRVRQLTSTRLCRCPRSAGSSGCSIPAEERLEWRQTPGVHETQRGLKSCVRHAKWLFKVQKRGQFAPNTPSGHCRPKSKQRPKPPPSKPRR